MTTNEIILYSFDYIKICTPFILSFLAFAIAGEMIDLIKRATRVLSRYSSSRDY